VKRAPLISVVIPTRNRAGLLSDCLDSLLSQDASTPFEVVVVDNGSVDETAAVLEARSRRDARVRTVTETEPGRSPALLAGMREADGGLLLFTDDDVVLDAGWVEAYARFFDRHPGLVLAGGPIEPVAKGGEWPPWFSPRALVSLGAVIHDGERALGPGEHLWGANMAARPDLFERFGSWDPRLGVRGSDHPTDPGRNEDVDLQYRVRERGGEVWFCPGARVRHRIDVPGPRRCLSQAFANGRNSYHRRAWPGMPIDPRRGARSVRSRMALLEALTRFLIWSAWLRVRRGPTVFERSWVAAWQSGWRLEDLLSNQVRDGFDRRTRALTHKATRAATRVAPEEA